MTQTSRAPRLAVVCDFPEEGWPSMDLCAAMLLEQLYARGGDLRAVRVCPPFRRPLGRLPFLGRTGPARNADRLFNRHRAYPRYMRKRRADYDFFHVVDHSYAQVVHALPAERTGVFCHDLDTFRCLLDPRAEPRPRWFRAMARRTLRGLQRAAVVFHTTAAVRAQILRHGLIDEGRLVKSPLGISPGFTPRVAARGGAEPNDAEIDEPAPDDAAPQGPFLLHVGSAVARKRIDVLLDVFAAVRPRFPGLRLVQVGGEWTAAQRRQIDRLGIGAALSQVRGVSREALARLYRAAAAVLQTSDAEGFALPVVEALACGAAVVASDIPVLREVAGDAGVFRPVGEIQAWASAVAGLLDGSTPAPARAVRLAQGARYSWAAHADTIARAYLRLGSTGS